MTSTTVHVRLDQCDERCTPARCYPQYVAQFKPPKGDQEAKPLGHLAWLRTPRPVTQKVPSTEEKT
jgi:hypothetical protein